MASLEIRNIGCLATPLGREARRGRRRARSAASATPPSGPRTAGSSSPARESDYAREYAGRPADAVLDARGRAVIPGLVDAHTHPGVAGRPGRRDRPAARRRELRRDRGRGRRNQRHGPRDPRRHGRGARARTVRRRLGRMLAHGTTTAEAKSGYGLTTKDEIRALSSCATSAADPALPRLVPTLLAAHEIPPEFRRRPRRRGCGSWPKRSFLAPPQKGSPGTATSSARRASSPSRSRRTILEAGRRAGHGPAHPCRRARALGRRHARRRARRGLGRPPPLHRGGRDRGARRGRHRGRDPAGDGLVDALAAGAGARAHRGRRPRGRRLGLEPRNLLHRIAAGRGRPRLPRFGPLGRGNADRHDPERRRLPRARRGGRQSSRPGSRRTSSFWTRRTTATSSIIGGSTWSTPSSSRGRVVEGSRT